MVKKTNKRSIKNKRLTKRKRGGLFGISTNANKDSNGTFKYVYTFYYSTDNNTKCITIKRKKAMLGNWYGVKEYKDEEEFGKLYIGSIFQAKTDRSMTARLLGSDKSGNKQNTIEPTNEFNAEKETRLSWLYANSGVKRAAKYGRMALSVGNTFATGRWPETGYYMVTDITSNNVKTSFKFSRIYYFDKTEAANYFTSETIDQQSDKTEKSNVNGFDLTSSKGKCSYSEQESCLIGLKGMTTKEDIKKIQEEEITNSNENFINNISFLGNDFYQSSTITDNNIKNKLISLQQKFRENK